MSTEFTFRVSIFYHEKPVTQRFLTQVCFLTGVFSFFLFFFFRLWEIPMSNVKEKERKTYWVVSEQNRGKSVNEKKKMYRNEFLKRKKKDLKERKKERKKERNGKEKEIKRWFGCYYFQCLQSLIQTHELQFV